MGWLLFLLATYPLKNPTTGSTDFKEIISFDIFIFTHQFLKDRCFLVFSTIMMCIISNLFFVSNVPSKHPKILMIHPSNCFKWRLLFFDFGLPTLSQKSFGMNVTLLPVSTCMSKVTPFNFPISLLYPVILSQILPYFQSAGLYFPIFSTRFTYVHAVWKWHLFLHLQHHFPKAAHIVFVLFMFIITISAYK